MAAHLQHLKLRGQRGMALVTVLILIVGMAGLAAALLIRLNLENSSSEEYIRINSASIAAEAGLEYGASTLWTNYLGGLGTAAPTMTGYRLFLDKLVAAGNVTNLLAKAIPLQSGASIDQITATRTDASLTSSTLKLKSTASFKGRSRTLVQSFTLSGQAFSGFEYALLANNIDCIMCHAMFDNIDRINNNDATKYGTFDRVKVAALQSLLIRTNDTHSHMAGTLYTRGDLLGTTGSGNNGITGGISPITSLYSSTFVGYKIDTSGKIMENKKGNLTNDKLDTVVPDKNGVLPAYGQVYANYPTNPDQMTDGILPTSFPSLIADSNGNKQVDDDEWKSQVSSSPAGSVTGGLVYGVPTGKTLDTTGLPAKSNTASDIVKSGYYDGNLVLVGTEKEPIVINGALNVNGDVVISGPVKGAGKIIARNNIYFAGNTTYADGTSYGKAADGTQDLMAYGAGGNILIGDFLTPENYNKTKYGKNKVVQYDDSNAKFPSYLSTETMDLAPGLDQGYSTSYAAAQMMLSNKGEYEKAQADKSYVPRYYTMGPGMNTYRQASDLTATDYESWAAAALTGTDLSNARISTLLPSSGWISPAQFKQMWWNDERSRSTDLEERFEIDGLLYTNNAIIGSVHSNGRHGSMMNGTLEIHGAVVASDVGILAPGDGKATKYEQGFRLDYDSRVKNYLSVGSAQDLSLVRGVKLVELPGTTL